MRTPERKPRPQRRQARLPARRPNLHGSPEFRLRSPGGRCLPLGGSQRGSPAAKSSELAEQFHRGHYHASKSSNTRGSEAGSASPPGGHTFRIAGMAGRSIERLPNHIRCRKCRAGTFQSRARCAPSDCHRPNERIAQQLPALPCGPCESRRRETPPAGDEQSPLVSLGRTKNCTHGEQAEAIHPLNT